MKGKSTGKQHKNLIFFYLIFHSFFVEVRNPLAAAMSACSFVSSAIQEDVQERDTESSALISSERRRESVQEDIEIIESSLHFINDLLRNMLGKISLRYSIILCVFSRSFEDS